VQVTLTTNGSTVSVRLIPENPFEVAVVDAVAAYGTHISLVKETQELSSGPCEALVMTIENP